MSDIEVHVVTPDRWEDLRELFGPSGAYANCWCTWWRMSAKDWDAAGGEGRRAVLAETVAAGETPGLLAYREAVPVGWVAVAPRTAYPRLQRSPHTRPVDDLPVYAVTCFWIDRSHRGQGVAAALLDGAVAYADGRGAPAVEGYPLDPAVRSVDSAQAFTGVVGLFANAGFVEIARRTATSRVVMRRDLRNR